MGKVTESMSIEFAQLYKQGLNTHEIGRMFNITHKTVCNHLRKTGVKLRPSGRQPRAIVKDIRLNKDLAYILGVIGPGDGYVHKSIVGLESVDKEFVEEFRRCLESITGLKCSSLKLIKPRKPNRKIRYLIRLTSKKFAEFLVHFEVPFKEKNWKVPKMIKHSPPKVKATYLRAFADSQGWIQPRCIGLCVKNTTGLKEIQKMFEDLEISTGFSSRAKASRVYITGRENLEIFAKKVGFVIKRKKEELESMLANYKQHQTPTEKINKLIPDMIRLRKQGLSYARIAQALDVSKPSVQKRLRPLTL